MSVGRAGSTRMLPTPNPLGGSKSAGSISGEVTSSQTPGVPIAGGCITVPPLPPLPPVGWLPAVPAPAPPVLLPEALPPVGVPAAPAPDIEPPTPAVACPAPPGVD